MPTSKRTVHRFSLAAMFAAMTLLFLYLASVMPTMRVTMYFLSSVFVMGLAVEEEYGLSFIMFGAVCGLSLLLVPNLLRVVPYALFFGHYGIGKHFIENRVRDKVLRYALKLIYFNAALALMYLLAQQILVEDVFASGWPFWVLVAVAEVAFVVYDFVFTKVTEYYVMHIRRFLMRR